MFSWLEGTKIPGPVIGIITVLVRMISFAVLAIVFDYLWNGRHK